MTTTIAIVYLILGMTFLIVLLVAAIATPTRR